MEWNWQRDEWPEFKYESKALEVLERQFQQEVGIAFGALKHIDENERNLLIIDLISTEAVKTSEIEGEILNRDSVQSSIRQNLGLDASGKRSTPAEQGIADMMVSLYKTFDDALSDEMLFEWHKMLTRGRTDLNDIGKYRTHEEGMQIISGADYAAKVHFEAPPLSSMSNEMTRFIVWFNASRDLPPLTRAGIAHLYFESIHPFEDGNGRIGRAIVKKSLSQSIGRPIILALSQTIQTNKKSYYQNLEIYNKDLEITGWLEYVGQTILDAQIYALRMIEFLIAKTKLYDQHKDTMNERQSKAIARMFREGMEGFKGGLSAENYIAISGTTRATATRDLADLVEKGVLIKSGQRRYTRYSLNLGTKQNF